MNTELITIGDEVLMGQVVNTNAAYLGERLTSAGVEVRWMSVVRDYREDILDAFRLAASRARAIIITGGLGPTPDDLTKPSLVEFFSDRLVFRDDLLKHVQELFSRRGLKLPETSRNQAKFPGKAQIIPNRYGTAAGIHYNVNEQDWFALPGVPFEMQAMVEDYVIPRLRESGLAERLGVRILRTCGVAESVLLEKLTRFREASSLVEIAFLPKYFGVDLKLTARGESAAEISTRLQQAEALLLPDLNPHLYAYDQESLPEVVGKLAKQKGVRIATAESCTGGLIGKLFTDIPGSSAYFERGIVVYSDEAKIELLGVPESLLETYGAVSSETAEAMAQGILRCSRADVVAAVTGIAGPEGGTAEKPVGLVYITVADRHTSSSHK
ncbi:MAG: competence/damage-inducible protein A, partial [bacterium]